LVPVVPVAYYCGYLRIRGMIKHNYWKFPICLYHPVSEQHPIYEEKDARDYLFWWVRGISDSLMWLHILIGVYSYMIYGVGRVDELNHHGSLTTDPRLWTGIIFQYGVAFDTAALVCKKRCSILCMIWVFGFIYTAGPWDILQNHMLFWGLGSDQWLLWQAYFGRISFLTTFLHSVQMFFIQETDLLSKLITLFNSRLLFVYGAWSSDVWGSTKSRYHRSSWGPHLLAHVTNFVTFYNTDY